MAKRKRELLTAVPDSKLSPSKRRLLVVGGIVVLLFAGTLFLAHADSLLISSIAVSGEKTVPAEKIREVALTSLGGNYGMFYPRRHAWWYSPERVVAAVQQAFPELSEVTIEQTGAAALSLAVTERRGAFLYCAASCYFMDETGFVFAPAPAYSDHLFFEFGGRVASPVGTRPVPPAEFAKITALERQLAGRLPAPLADARFYRVEPLGPGEWQLLLDWPSAPNQAPVPVRFRVLSPIEPIAPSLAAALGTDAFQRDWQEAAGHLEYLDVRFLPKVFYKFRE